MSSFEVTSQPDPSVVDRAFRLAYLLAYRALRFYWGFRRPLTHGALIAIWNQGKVLLVRNSYVPYYSAPGGYLRRNEEGRAAAVRELAEEIGLRVRPEELVLALEVTHDWENKHDHVQVFTLDLNERPSVRIDNREVIEAEWFTPEQARTLALFPPLKQVIEARL
jgi:8-oxo-dGTP diphosphatase